ncbi:MAG: hypothetical protein EPN84_06620 [Legionella sp.]|nr:MAG: hypothetical protein EPN84_06620 [Legionella sp.]
MNEKKELEIKQNFAFQEILSSETSYNNTLILLGNILDQDKFTKHDLFLQDIKQQINTLKFISTQILKNLQTAVKNETTDEERQLLNHHRRQLLKAFYEAYKPYVKLYHSFLAKLASSPATFLAIDTELKTKTRDTLSSLLIMPMQRGFKYDLLVKALKESKNLEEKHLRELNELKELIADCLKDANTNAAAPASPGYRFGDGIRTVWSHLPEMPSLSSDDDYQFGDYTLRFLGVPRRKKDAEEGAIEKSPEGPK